MCSSFTEYTYPSASIGPYLPQQLGPGQRLIMTVRVGVPSGLEGSLVDQAKISGGGIASVEASAANIANANPVFGTLHFGASLTDASKVNPYTQAGGHPYQVVTEFNFEDFSTTEPQGQWQDFGAAPVHDPQQVDGNLPPGLIVNPQGVPHCALAEYFSEECARSTAVGSAGLRLGTTEAAFNLFEPIYNLQPEGDYPGQLGITVGGAPFIVITSGIRSNGDYGITASNVAIQHGLRACASSSGGFPPNHLTMQFGV